MQTLAKPVYFEHRINFRFILTDVVVKATECPVKLLVALHDNRELGSDALINKLYIQTKTQQ
ncbi:hypothetical protein PsorP6_011626 [Peronosclerospora sorghi]|uniref:Uncharacterized protein n=1 Tax=Peronosclerospora sorghi TaxID=230839 RepID=A0ACC0WJF1_9STRA|nr:hypothetical protein PsorP6_011626 [Peronosclerospora sorghi]